MPREKIVDKKSHPQASLINNYLWGNLFEKKLSSLEIECLKGDVLPESMPGVLDEASKTRLLLSALISSYNDNDSLLNFARSTLGLSEIGIIRCLLLTGCVAEATLLIDSLSSIQRSRFKGFFEREYVQIFSSLVASGNKSAFEEVSSLAISSERKAKDYLENADYLRFALLAAQNGQVSVIADLEFYLSDAEIKAAIKAGNYEAYRLAARNGHQSVIAHLESYLSTSEIKEAIKACNYEAYRCAAQYGYQPVIAHLESHLSASEIKASIKADNHYAYRFAA